jgi:nicotinamide-nucleotide amidase
VAALKDSAVLIELINTGTEILLGRTLNTHQQWLGRQLADRGYPVARQSTVPDTAPEIQQAVREALRRADLVLVTGGLGPTTDDLTREGIAELLGKPLHEDARVLAHIRGFFAGRGRPLPPGNEGQARVPAGAQVLWNANGTAPGLAMAVDPNPFREGGKASWLVLLPGPPRELRPMFTDQVVPLLLAHWPQAQSVVSRTFRTIGIGESALQALIAGPLRPMIQGGLDLGYCAHTGQVDVRLAAHGAPAQGLVDAAEQALRACVGTSIFGEEDEAIEAVLVRLLAQRGQTLALAESCTGGALAHRITNVPGASAVFLAGLVTYSNDAKGKFLGVTSEALLRHGAVSDAVVREMAEGARRVTGADYALAVTGIAGPGGGTAQKPVGTVYLALAGEFPTVVQAQVNAWDRETFKQATANQAFELLRRAILRPG